MFHFPELEVVLDPDLEEVTHRGSRVALTPLSFRLLHHLLVNHDRVVSADELLRQVWPEVRVTTGSVRQGVRVLRRELEAAGIDRPVVLTERGRGYRLAPDLVVTEGADGTDRLVGRERELAALVADLDRARMGEPKLVIVTGAAGIGKTRLAESLVQRARATGVDALFLHCADSDALPPLWVWSQVIDHLRRDRALEDALSGADANALRTGLDLIENPNAPSPLLSDPSATRDGLFEAIGAALRIACRDHTRLIVLDDLQSMDADSLELLEAIASDPGAARLLVVATLRDPTDGSGPALERKHHWIESGIATGLTLRPLSSGDAEELVSTLAPSIPPERREELAYSSGGNPLLLRLNVEANRRASTGEAALHDVRLGVMRLFESLPERTRALLRSACLLGKVVRPRTIAAMEQLGTVDVEAGLEPAFEIGLLRRRNDGALAFVHGLVKETLARRTAPDERAAVHRKAFDALRSSPDASAAELAAHAFEARALLGDDRAREACEDAAETAAAALAFEEAGRLFEQALECVGPDSGSERLRLLVGLIEARARAGHRERLERVADSAIALAQSLGDARSQARITLALGIARGSQEGRSDGRWIARIEDALAACSDESIERARLLSLLAEALWFEPPFARARELVSESVELVSRLDAPDALGEALLRAYRMHCTGPGDEAMRAELAQRLESALPSVRDRLVAMEAYVMLVYEAALWGDRARFGRWVERASAENDALGGMHARWWALAAQGASAMLDARFEEAESIADESLRLGEAIRTPLARPHHLIFLFSLRHAQERLPELVDDLEDAVRWSAGNPGWIVSLRLAEVAAGRTGPARELLNGMIASGLPLPDMISHTPVLFELAEIAIGLGDSELASPLYDRLLPLAEQHGFLTLGFCPWGSHQGRLGRLAALRGDLDLAETHLRDAIARDRRFGDLVAIARSQIALADVLERRGNEGDAAAARKLRAECGQLRADLGLPPSPERVA